MITIYTFQCDNCSYILEKSMEISKYKALKKCPECKKNKMYRRYDLDNISGAVRLANSEIKKLGHLAQRNTERMSQDQIDSIYRKNNAYKNKPNSAKKELPSGMSRVEKPENITWE